MAGTVVNENNVVYKTLQKAINKKGYSLSLKYVLQHGAGKEKYQAIHDILSLNDAIDLDREARLIFDDFEKLLEKAYQNLEVTTYEGVADLIRSLRTAQILIALNTGYNRKTAQLLLDKMKWKLGDQYDALITAEDVALGRPNPDMIVAAMEVLYVTDTSKVLKAGDSIIDIEEGKNAHCGITIGVTTGAHTREQLTLANPTYILDSLVELRSILFI